MFIIFLESKASGVSPSSPHCSFIGLEHPFLTMEVQTHPIPGGASSKLSQYPVDLNEIKHGNLSGTVQRKNPY